MPRPLYEIAREIRADRKNLPSTPYHQPYLDAMGSMDKITDAFGAERGADVVVYFLSNASRWRGDVARRIKAELNSMVKEARKR